MFDLIAFDADDTLWHSENTFAEAQENFRQIVAPYCDINEIEDSLHRIMVGNLGHYGYGIKGFTLSLIETAITMSEGRISAKEIQALLDQGKAMLAAEVHLLDHVPETLAKLAENYRLMVITKGDLIHQESKIERSGLREYFDFVEIVSDKTHQTYTTLLNRYQIIPSRFLMVGNSLRSDILPVIELGGHAVYIPYHITWAHEVVAISDEAEKGYFELADISLLPALLEGLQESRL
jgi:putative hydrolase of the HAD superfamily